MTISAEEASAQYARAVEAHTRAKMANQPDYILDKLQDAIAFWEPKMVKQDELREEIHNVMISYYDAKRTLDVG